MKDKTCCVEGCGRAAMFTRDLCANCYMRIRYWSHKTPNQIVRRIQQLHLWENRMQMMTPGVTVMKRRKA